MINWIKKQFIRFKKWLLGLIGISVVFGATLIATEPVTLESKIITQKVEIEQAQEIYKTKNSKYQGLPKTIKDEIESKTIEYVTPKGEAGYQIIMKGDNFIKSFGYGPEAESRTWGKIIEPNF